MDPLPASALPDGVRSRIVPAINGLDIHLLEAGWEGDGEMRALIGGEAVPREIAADLVQRCGSVWNMYGPTETTIWSCVHRIEPGEVAAALAAHPGLRDAAVALRGPEDDRHLVAWVVAVDRAALVRLRARGA